MPRVFDSVSTQQRPSEEQSIRRSTIISPAQRNGFSTGRKPPRGASRFIRFAIIVVALGTLGFSFLNPKTALLRLADAWSLITPKHLAATSQLAAASTAQTNNNHALSDRESSLLAECVRLRQQLDRLQPTHVQSDRLVHINAVDAQVLWASRDGREAFIGLTDPKSTDRDAFVVADSAVDIGSAIGIEADGLVLAGRRLIGRVESVGLRSCGVIPTTSADFQIPVEIVRRASSTTFVGASGTYRGDGASAGVVDFIPADAAVSVGDEVFTQADSLWSGERLHVGTISAADLPAGEPHWRIAVTPSGIVAPRDHVLVLRPRIRANQANNTLLSTGSTRDSQRAK